MGTKLMLLKVFFLNRGGSFDLGDSMEGALSSGSFSPPVNRVNSDKFYIYYGPQFTHCKPKGWGEVCSDTEEPHSAHFHSSRFLLHLCCWVSGSYRLVCEVPKCVFPILTSLYSGAEKREVSMGKNARKASHLLHNAWMKQDETYFFFCKQSSWFLSL